MSKIVRGGQSGSLDHIDSSQGTFRTQISALTDAVRQLGGNPEIGAGAVVNDPLNAPYVIYVNPYTGNDTFVGGNYSTSGDATQRIELQRLECGYSEARPFKTINRAVIEAGIITAKSFYTSPLANYDLVSIILAPGVYTIYNGTGAGSVPEWDITKSPSTAELTAFNSASTGGLILPRGASLCGIDLRKTIIRPDVVPSVADETSNASNRRTIFKVTGTGYYFGFTFMDKVGTAASHHLLHCFEFASQAELDEFYGKIQQAFGGANNTGGISNALAVTRSAEYEIVGPQPAAGAQTVNTDTTLSASPYIFNCSIRSNYGLSGVYADGAKTSGFRSLVIAQFTGVSLQRDLSCWEKYDAGQSTKWSSSYFTDYADYINTSPDNVRMHPSRRSFHIRAVNNAVIQEVSVFAIGQGIHHWTENGGEITITNSNSNFGGCAALSEGYRTASALGDTGWTISRIRVGLDLTDKQNNIQRIYLGTVSAVTNNTITLSAGLGESTEVEGVPENVAAKGYTLRSGSRVWVENPLGADWSSTFTSSAWNVANSDILNTNGALQNEDGETPVVIEGTPSSVGKRVYIRRLVDTRTPDERRYSLRLNNTSQGRRTPVRDYALQLDTAGASINSELPGNKTLTILQSGKLPVDGQGVYASTEVTLRRANTFVTWTTGALYKRGDTVAYNGKHYTCIKDNSDTAFTADKWQESFVHMPTDYATEDFYKNDVPIIVFDNDSSNSEQSTTLGYNLSTVWTSDSLVQAQYRAAVDYKALHLLLTALGFSSSQAHTILIPRPSASRERDPASSSDMGGYVPSGAANALANWPVEFRRPSVIRLFGHAWEWAGYLNYTKSIPAYQGDLSQQNKFTYYFTNADGGRVYGTGFNEEGYQVSPRGLEDITTGETVTVENLGASDIALETPTEFSDLTLNGTTTINDSLVINANSITFPLSAEATTTDTGVGEIASISEIENTVASTTDSGLNAAGSKFITAAGLKYWATWARVITQREGTTTFYVVPDNAVNGSTYVFNGTSATLVADPSRTGSALENDLPVSRARAVKLSNIATYANAAFSENETVDYVLANGPYWTDVTFEHIANILGATNSFPSGNAVADFNTSTKPTTDVKALHDANNPFLIPCFATGINVEFISGLNQSRFRASPTYLTLKRGGTVQGVCWLTAQRTLNDTTNYPNSLYSLNGSQRTSTISVRDYIDRFAVTHSLSFSFLQFFVSEPNIRFDAGTLNVYDCVFGARAPGAPASLAPAGLGPNIFPNGGEDKLINASGIYFLGNVHIDSLPLATAAGLTVSSNMLGTRNGQYFIAGKTGGGDPCTLTIIWRNRVTSGPNVKFDANSIHVLDDNGYYGLMANREATNGSRGATMAALIGPMEPFSRLRFGSFGSWAYYSPINANSYAGVAGVFGDHANSQGPEGIALSQVDYVHNLAWTQSVWQQAASGAKVTFNISPASANGGRIVAYSDSADNPLNIKSHIYMQGIDTSYVKSVAGELIDIGVTTGGIRPVFFG